MNTVRETGLQERYSALRYALGYESLVTMAATYTSTTSSVLDRSKVIHALRSVVEKHHPLCVQISSKPADDIMLVRLPVIDLAKVVVSSNDESSSLEDVLAAEFVKPIHLGTDLPLWRVTIHGTKTILFTYHHSIGDGRSGLAFHTALADALNSLPPDWSPSSDDHILHTPADLNIPRPVEQMTETKMSFVSICKLLWSVLGPTTWQANYVTWAGHPSPSQPVPNAFLRLRTISPSDAKAILALCKAHKCTLSGFMQTLYALVLAHLVADRMRTGTDDAKFKYLQHATSIDLRRFTGLSEDTFADHVSELRTYFDILEYAGVRLPPTQETFPWDKAAAYSSELHQNMGKSRELMAPLRFLFRRPGRAESYTLGLLGQKRELTLGMSNLGRISPPSSAAGTHEGGWKIEDVSFCAVDIICGAAMRTCLVGAPSGAINATYLWGEGAVDIAFADAFVDGVHAAIATILDSKA